jgi:two-component system NarL family sensor kinase
MESPVLFALAAAGGVASASGVGLWTVRRTRPCAVLLAFGGLATVAAALLDTTEHAGAARPVLVATFAVLAPLALTTYPRFAWRHPVDFVALVTVGAAGAMAVVYADDDAVTGSMGLVLGCVLLGYTWWRIERADADDRRSLTWMSLAVTLAALVAFVVAFVRLGVAGEVVGVLTAGLVGPALYVGVRRPEVVDVRGLVVRMVVLATAAVGYVAVFMSVESLVEILGGEAPPVGTLAVMGALAATTFHPLQVVLRGVVDELLFGARPDPLGAATQVVGYIGDDPATALHAVREALVLPYAALRIDGTTVATSGVEVTHTRTVPLGPGTDRIGDLVVGLRAGDLALSPGDQHVLRLVAPLLTQTLRAQALAGELQESRGQAIAAIEEERRRLRRDLHDGLGPRLSGIAFTSDAVRNLVRNNPESAEQLLQALRQETVTAIEEIRGLVYAMRPPALDELGLVGALRQHASTLRRPDGTPLRVDVRADELADLPAAVEVAAYRIVVEALANAVRHSGSVDASICLALRDGTLDIEVTDTGAADTAWRSGVGLASMRERAAELGGTVTASGTRHGGRVHAALPLP